MVTTVVDDPEPSVYVRTTLDEAAAPPLAAALGADVTPVPRGTVGVGVATAPADVAEAEYDARAAELADSASATGQTVCRFISMLSCCNTSSATYGREGNGIGNDKLAGRLRGTSRAIGD